jgi:acyl-CoA reductase-like NAD-dependent aldehyde dehydrogenase/uncharacterized protein (DUF2141 family)
MVIGKSRQIMSEALMVKSREAFKNWSAKSTDERLSLFSKLKENILLHIDEIISSIITDTKKAPLDALGGDILVTLETIRFIEKNGKRALQNRKIPKPGFFFWGTEFYEEFNPYGTVLVLAPWNYPFQLSMVPALSALACGNTVILKCSELAPKTAKTIEKLFELSGFPKNVIQVVDGGPELGTELIDLLPDKIFLTGSLTAGKSILKRAANNIIPVHLELGGKDVMIVFSDASLERAISSACYGAFSNSGQVCVGVKKIYVHTSVLDFFVEGLKRETSELRRAQDYLGELGPLVKKENVVKIKDYIEKSIKEGFRLETGLSIEGSFVGPVILMETQKNERPNDTLESDEVFGPVVSIVPFETEEDAIKSANRSPFGLSSSVWTKDIAKGKRVAKELVVGSCSINDVVRQIANPYAPFGGEKLSGTGRYHGQDGLRTFCRQKTVMISTSRKKKEINWFPFRRKTFDQLKRVIRFRHGKLFSLIMVAFMSTTISGSIAGAAQLTLHVDNIESQAGSLAFNLFSSEKGFPSHFKMAVQHGFVKIPDDLKVTIIIDSLPLGTYAVSVYQDINNDQKLNTNFLGIPTEPVGVSNNPKPRMGPPLFSAAKFDFNQDTEIIIYLVNPHGK